MAYLTAGRGERVVLGVILEAASRQLAEQRELEMKAQARLIRNEIAEMLR
jgi:hypothetical protein